MIETNYFWWNVAILSVGTLIIRSSIISISHKVKISERHRELFTFIPASLLPALIGPMTYFHKGHVSWLLGKERLVVLAFAAIVTYLLRSMILTVMFGLIALYLLTQF